MTLNQFCKRYEGGVGSASRAQSGWLKELNSPS